MFYNLIKSIVKEMALFLGVPETLSIAEWKQRFKWNFDKAGEVNAAGYGP